MKGDFESLDPIIPELFDRGARGLEEKEGEVWAYFADRIELPFAGRWTFLEDEDWLEAYRRSLKPVVAGRFWVGAPWHEPEAGLVPIFIEPGMAFGSGHHETTQMALKALSESVRPGMRVLDLGTGSGILAIAAAKLGADVLALDIDPAAVRSARENAEKNAVKIEVKKGSLDEAEGPFDLIVANLYAALHERFAEGYGERLAPGGVLLATGVLKEQAKEVGEALKRTGLSPAGEEAQGEWVLLRFVRERP